MTKRNNNKKKGRNGGRGSYRSDALAQGTGAANSAPFPVAPRRGTKRKHGQAFGDGAGDPDCLDAFCPAHLALPRPVAPYIVVRVTTLLNTDSRFCMFGPMMSSRSQAQGGGRSQEWCNQIGIAFDSDAGAHASGSALGLCLPSRSAGFSGCQLTPAAFSVQLMNPGALQNTHGICAMGRLKLASTFTGPDPDVTPLPPFNAGPTVEDVANNCVSYFTPRLMSAAKVAMRGVQVNAIPVDMNDLSEFTPYDQRLRNDYHYYNYNNEPTQPAGLDKVVPQFHGFAPIFISNPDEIPLQYLVSVEYRVRFDPTNPAASAGVAHKPSTVQTWDNVITGMVKRGNGVVDIAEKVVEYGANARKLLGRASAVAGLLL